MQGLVLSCKIRCPVLWCMQLHQPTDVNTSCAPGHLVASEHEPAGAPMRMWRRVHTWVVVRALAPPMLSMQTCTAMNRPLPPNHQNKYAPKLRWWCRSDVLGTAGALCSGAGGAWGLRFRAQGRLGRANPGTGAYPALFHHS